MSGPDGPAVRGPDGPAVRGPDGPAVRGPDGPVVRGPDGPAVRGPDGPAVRGPDGPAVRGPDGPAVRGPDGPAVRVSVAPSSALDGDPTRVVALPTGPLRPLRPEIGNVGILGGSSAPGPEATVPAPSSDELLVDGEPARARLEWLDPSRALLMRDHASEGRARTSSADDRPEPRPPADDPSAHEPPVRRRLVLGPVRHRPDGTRLREVVIDGWRIELVLEDERRAALRERSRRDGTSGGGSGPLEVRAIIPGRIVAVSVGAGDEVAAGQQLLVLEAMKMQNELRAPREGRVRSVTVAVGTNVEVGDVLMVIE